MEKVQNVGIKRLKVYLGPFFLTIIQSIKFRFLYFYFLVDSRPFLLVDSILFFRSKRVLFLIF